MGNSVELHTGVDLKSSALPGIQLGEVYGHVRGTIVGADEADTLVGVEPLDDTGSHACRSFPGCTLNSLWRQQEEATALKKCNASRHLPAAVSSGPRPLTRLKWPCAFRKLATGP